MPTIQNQSWTPEAVRQLVARLAVSYDDLARACRVSESQVRHWSNGTRQPGGPATVLLDLISRGKIRVKKS